MFRLDDEFLKSVGLGALPDNEKNAMLQQIYETLELRVGMKLAEQMSDAQLDEFEGFIQRNDEAGALKWLETNLPHYRDVVAEELEKLKTEIKTNAEAILQASGAQASQQAQTPQPTSQTSTQVGYTPPSPFQRTNNPNQPAPEPNHQPAHQPPPTDNLGQPTQQPSVPPTDQNPQTYQPQDPNQPQDNQPN